jgi:enoyl-CoA hydratase/carnithine racemase
MSIDEGMEYQLKENSSLFYTEDLKEGVKAFLEKRKANYKGR